MVRKKAGRAGQKKKAQQYNSEPRAPRSSGKFAQLMADSDLEDEPSTKFRGFAQNTPQSAAFNTPKSANSIAKLRHQTISFVSAEIPTPTIGRRNEVARQDTIPSSAKKTGREEYTFEDSDDDELEDNIDYSAMQTNIVMEADMEIPEISMARMHIQSTADTMDIDGDTAADPTSDINITGMDEDARPRGHPASPETLGFVVDTVGDASLAAKPSGGSRRSMKRAPSPAPSDSSEEVVLFHGRNKPTFVNDPVVQAPKSTLPVRQLAPISNGASRSQPRLAHPAVPATGWGSHSSKYDPAVTSEEKWSPAPDVPYWRTGKDRTVSRPDFAPSTAENKAFKESLPRESNSQFSEPSQAGGGKSTEETVTALQADWKSALKVKKAANKRGSDSEDEGSKASKPSRRRKRGRKKDNRAMRKAIISDESGDSEAAYDDYMENLRAQLDSEDGNTDEALFAALRASKHSASIAGPSLVVDGEEVDEDQVLPSYKKVAKEDDEASYRLKDDDSAWEDDSDSTVNPDMDELSSDDSMNASELESDIEYNQREMWEDEDDLRRRRVERMTDEHLARLFAKQEEFGMNGGELLIDDGGVVDMSEQEFGDVRAARAGLSDLTNSSFGRPRNKHGMPRRGKDKNYSFPDASTLADTLDQYGPEGFDIMDMDRPSLRPTKKARKGKLPPGLEEMSDDDLKDELRQQWATDRGKKAQKKAEREELRREGLLGKSGRKGKPDLSQKYAFGMTMEEVHGELREFLQDDDLMQRSFPAMDKVDRKALHEIATALNLESKSQGTGKKRFPIIYKTSQTIEYSQGIFDEVMRMSKRGFLTNSKAKGFAKNKGKFGKSGKGPGRGGGFDKAATGLRHGEIVGAGAAEISHTSFGHKMMEKMGWSKGMALGKDGEGMLAPVEQRMRVGTAGLG